VILHPQHAGEARMKVRTNGIELHVEQRGAGAPALVFLHYWGGSSRTWSKVVDILAPTRQCVAVDFRGWGQSDAPAKGYGLADMAADIDGVIAALQLERYVLVGHSMGGKVAQLVASRRPPGLAGLVLVAPAPPPPLGIPAQARAMMATAYTSAESVAVAIDQTLAGRPLGPSDRQQVIVDSLRGAPQAQVAWPSSTSLEDISAEVAAINVPVVVIAGEIDKVETVAWLQTAMMPLLRDATLQVLPGVGHLSPLEAPQDVAGMIRIFVEQLDAV
jgi:pimeloyl-ACP methyl ester carboxylesterase